MSAEPGSTGVAQAYDRLAGVYDRQVLDSRWMRAVLWRVYLQRFRAGQRLLDLSCGTGLDTIFLAQQGLQVVGLDISAGMLAQLQDKAARLRLVDRVQAVHWDLNEFSSWSLSRFDGMISGFAGLSTVSNLSGLASHAAHLLNPGGYFIVHMLNRFSLATWLELVRQGHWWAALRAGRAASRMVDLAGIPVQHYLYYPREAYRRFFAPHFQLCSAYGLGEFFVLEMQKPG